MKRVLFLVGFVFLLFTARTYGQELRPTGTPGVYISVKTPVYFDVSPPLSEMIENAKPVDIDEEEAERREELIEQAFEKAIKSKISGTALNSPDPLSKIQRNYQNSIPKAADLTEYVNFDGVNNIAGYSPPDTHGDVSPGYYMQCTNVYTAIFDKNGNTVKSPFPTSDFWQGTGYDDRNDGDAIILWDEDAQRWFVSQFYLPSSGDQYILIAVSTSSDPTGTYNRYVYNYTYMPDYPKFAIWHDGYYMGANAFDQNNSYSGEGVYISAFDRSAMIAGNASATNVTIQDANKWAVFPVDADALPSSSIGGCFFVTDELSAYTGNDEVYIYQYNVDWTNHTGTLSAVTTFNVASYDLFNSDTEVPQSGTSQKLDLLHYRTMYRSLYKHFSDHDAIVMSRTVNDGGTAAVRWYEFRNSGSGWSLYQQGTYNPGDGLWRWMPSIAMNDNGDIALGYSVSSSSTYPSIRCVARYASDPLNVMTTNEYVGYTGSNAQTSDSRWGDYSMVSVDPSDNTSFWFTTEYFGSSKWQTRIMHFALPIACTPPSSQATNFGTSAIGDNQMTVSWTRGNGDRVLVLAHEGAAVDQDPANGTAYTANSVFGNGSQIGTGNYVVYDGTGGSVTVTGLTPGTQYYFSVYEYASADNCYLTPGLTGNATTTGTPPCTPCYSYGNTDYNTSTTRVIFNTIDNASAKPTDGNGNAYSDYTNLSTDITIGNSYNLTVQVNTDGSYTIASKVWIDWNHDCDFDDAGEEYDLGTANNVSDGATSNSPLSITVPAGALTGQTIMRVSSRHSSAATSCQTDFDGEVEDYTVNVISNSTPLITVSETNLDFGKVGLGYYRTKTYDVSGSNLTDDITITGTSDFQVSTDGTNFATSVTVPQSGGNASATITVKFEPAAVQSYTGTISNASTGATTKNIACTGEGVQWFFPPTNLAGSFNTGTNNVVLTWNDPNTNNSSSNWYEYANVNDITAYSSGAYPTRVVYFHNDELGYTYPIKISQLRNSFIDDGNWTSTQFRFVIYAEDLTTKLYESEILDADQNGSTSVYTYTLAEPVIITGDFFVGVETVASDGSPFSTLKQQSDNNYHTYVYDGTNWYYFSDGTNAYDMPQAVYIDGAKGGKYITASDFKTYDLAKATDENIINLGSPKSLLSGFRVYKDGSQIGTDLPATTHTYTDNNVCGSHDYYVTAIYTGYDGESAPTSTVTMSYASPAITTQPSNATVCIGDNATFSITATGDEISYQWQKDGSNISGATSSSYTVTNASSGDAGSYTCVVTNACASVTSNAATLTVNPNTAISSQPSDATVCEGDNATFSVTATGSNLTYQWQKDGSNISGATSSSYTVTSATSGDAGSYTCVVTGDCGTVTSNSATLTVNPATAITSQPSNATVCEGDNATFSVTATGSNLTYQWQKDGVAISGATSSSFTLSNVTSTDAATYTCVVTGDCGSVTSNSATLTVNPATTITSQTGDQTACSGSDVTFSVTATGSNLTYQWQKDGSNISDATSASLTLSNVTSADQGAYTCAVSGDCGNVTSNTMNLTITSSLTLGTVDDQTACPNGTATFTVTANGTNTTYQWRKDGTNLTDGGNISGAATATLTISNVSASDIATYSCYVTSDCGDATSNNATLTLNEATAITTQPSDAIVCEGAGVTFSVTATGSNLTYQWYKSGVAISGATSATYSLTGVTTTDAASYYCEVSGDCGNVTSNTATLTVNENTAITTQPQSQDVCEGADVTFTVVASGSNLTYQWQKDGSNISGATSASLTLSNVTSADQGAYTCAVSGDCGSVTSDAAVLTIGAGVTITEQPQSQTACTGGDVTFTVTATGDNLTYQWQKDGSDISGATSTSLALNNVTSADNGSYTCVITSDCGSVTSDAATLTVVDNTSITQQPQSQDVCEGADVTFTVVATGSNLTYQWQKDGNDISGATSDSYTITGATSADEGDYTCTVTSDCGTATSDAATLSLLPATTIVTQPVSITDANEGDTVVFTVVASGNNLTYQWQKDAQDIDGATTDTYTIFGVTTDDNGQYNVVVTGDCGSVTSDTVLLTVVTDIQTVRELGIKVYPNPTTGQFFIAFEKITNEFTVEIIDANGQMIYSGKLDAKVNTLDMSDKAAGIYTLHIYNQNYNKVVKLIVK